MKTNNKYEMQQALLWNMRCLRSGFGRQVYSAKVTEPGVPIGCSVRAAFSKVRRATTSGFLASEFRKLQCTWRSLAGVCSQKHALVSHLRASVAAVAVVASRSSLQSSWGIDCPGPPLACERALGCHLVALQRCKARL